MTSNYCYCVAIAVDGVAKDGDYREPFATTPRYMYSTAFVDSPRMALPKQVLHPSPPKAVVRGTWRLARADEDVTGLAWVVALCACFLLVGLVGIWWSDAPLEITLSGRAGMGASDANTSEMTMAELQAEEQVSEVTTTEPVTPEVPQPMEVQQQISDLPELAEALVTEDVFTVPAAPKIETAIQTVDPAAPKPKEKPKPTVAKPRRATSVAATTTSGTQGSGGGAGGNGTVGAGSGNGKYPKPNYPSTARARGVAGQVILSLSINPAGKVEDASAVSSTGGFNSQECETIASFVERFWQFPPGAYRKLKQPIVFRLDSR